MIFDEKVNPDRTHFSRLKKIIKTKQFNVFILIMIQVDGGIHRKVGT
jgi:hypothetical protein